MPDRADDEKPLVASICGTFLKPEMQSIYRQVAGLRRTHTVVYTQSHENAELFPFEPVVQLTKLARPRARGNFVLRFWFKHVLKKWPPPFPINKQVEPYYPYDLVTLLKRDKPALAHVYYGHKAVHYLEMLQAWGGPWVVSFHGVDVSKFLDQPGYLEKLKMVFAEARLVMGRSHSLLQRLEDLGCPKEKLRLNHTPIPLSHLTATVREAPPDGAWRLVQACRLIQKKGILTTIKALTIVKQHFPNVRYILCGDGPLRAKIEQTAAELGMRKNVELVGWLDQAGLQHEYQRAHLFLHPSEKTKAEDQEGIPNSMLEAMATGLPVVATLHGGIPEAVASGSEGLLVPEKTPGDLAQSMLDIMNHPSTLRRFSENAAVSVREKFSSETQIAALENVYFEAMQAAPQESSCCR
jgi:glycosyltransferase involved in cell wall biosynthesis